MFGDAVTVDIFPQLHAVPRLCEAWPLSVTVDAVYSAHTIFLHKADRFCFVAMY